MANQPDELHKANLEIQKHAKRMEFTAIVLMILFGIQIILLIMLLLPK